MREVRVHGRFFEREERLALNEVIRGRTNAVGSVTLAANAGSTTVDDVRCTPFSRIFLFPTTANAATEFGAGTLRISTKSFGSYVITHTNTAQADKTFDVLILSGPE